MRPVLPGDLSAAARVLLRLPPEGRAEAARRLVHEAAVADRYRLLTGRVHPEFGTGSLMSRALRAKPLPEPLIDQPDYARCLIAVLEAILDAQPVAQETQRVAVGSSSRRFTGMSSPQSSQ
ncbi:hypothetical protein VK792_13120 [Mesobacterium sp. TK19101]|uniref:DUF7742 domain-containing protein n=1 Tax=Mesobacterium hydrothermale TaxID=3111907 RepID=A0ABU6HIE6_9RHOB|nr:hypothetical protein [Mesobacterium sp. TK19101]MEC3862229.1 hypothetical protein [Mesobacterium sp. TK19101]